MNLYFTLRKFFLQYRYLQKIICAPKTFFALNMSLFILLISVLNLFSLHDAYSQLEPSPDTLTGDSERGNETARTNVSSISNGNASEDFRTIREQYESSWESLSFSSSFDTFLEAFQIVDVYGGYQAKPSNVFEPGETIYLYVEPVGFGHQENIDQLGNPIYSVNITSTITVSDSQGNVLGTQIIPFQVQNSYRKVTELFLLLEILQDPEFPVGEYVATYRFTDGTTGESFELVKDIRIVEPVTVG
jgi:hypothetical protein